MCLCVCVLASSQAGVRTKWDGKFLLVITMIDKLAVVTPLRSPRVGDFFFFFSEYFHTFPLGSAPPVREPVQLRDRKH